MADVPNPKVPAPPRPGGRREEAPPGSPSGPFAPTPSSYIQAQQRQRQTTAGDVRYTTTTTTATAHAPAGPYSGSGGDARVGGMHIAGASTMYTILGVLLLAGGLFALIMPYKLTDIFFRGERKYYDVVFEELWRSLAATFFAAAATCYALKHASDLRMMNDSVVQRLQVGFFLFALLAVLLHLIHLLFVKSLTWWGLLLGALLMAPTLLLPTVHLGMSGGFGLGSMMEGVSAGFGNLFAPRRVTLTVIMYSLLTILFTIAGLLYLIVPKPSMKWVFGYHAGKRATFLWQWIGSALLFLFPAMTYTCQERGIEGLLYRTVPKVLNVGLLVASLFHILEFGTLLATDGVAGRWLLPVLFGHWVLTLLTSILGLTATEPTPAYEYEPLHAGEGTV